MHDWPVDPPTLRLRVPTGAAGAALARESVLAHLANLNLSPRTVNRIELVLEELLMNLALHGACTEADLTAAGGPEAVVLQLEDEGPAFDPGTAPERAVAQSIGEARPGGLGLRLMHKAVSEWRYERLASGHNRVTALIARA